MTKPIHRLALAAAVFLAPLSPLTSHALLAQVHITTPRQALGFDIGDDYHLATYTQLDAYWRTLARQSPRMVLREIGKSAEGRPELMAIITSPENQKLLARYQGIARRLASAQGLSDSAAHALAAQGKAVVWIDGGLHATEVLGAHQLMELVYEMVSRNDPETRNMTHVMFKEWFPQIVYNHHQTGPAGAVLFAPPFRDPFNYHFDPLIPLGVEIVGTTMHERLAAEGMPGATMRSGSSYSTWWNGGLRTTAYFHNMIGLLTETIGNPTPFDIQLVPERQLPTGDLPYPVAP